MAPHGVYAYCAMQQAVEDAKLSEADWSNPDTGLYAASGGSPFLLGYYLERMRKQGVMRCQPLGVVACISGTVNFNLVSHFKIKGAPLREAFAKVRSEVSAATKREQNPAIYGTPPEQFSLATQ